MELLQSCTKPVMLFLIEFEIWKKKENNVMQFCF